jgi:hypothetical protein
MQTPHLMAGTCLSLVLILLLLAFLQRYFVQRLTLTGIKASLTTWKRSHYAAPTGDCRAVSG